MKKYIFTLLIAATAISLQAQRDWDKVKITVEKAAENIYVPQRFGRQYRHSRQR